MNPNVAQSLDPKLKETYDRVMGTHVNSSPQPKPIEPTPPSPIQNKPFEPTPAMPGNVGAPEPVGPTTQVFVAATPDTGATVKVTPGQTPFKQPGKGISPIIFIVLGLVFFVAYTVIWLKVFSII